MLKVCPDVLSLSATYRSPDEGFAPIRQSSGLALPRDFERVKFWNALATAGRRRQAEAPSQQLWQWRNIIAPVVRIGRQPSDLVDDRARRLVNHLERTSLLVRARKLTGEARTPKGRNPTQLWQPSRD
jgi:hypothetical protein